MAKLPKSHKTAKARKKPVAFGKVMAEKRDALQTLDARIIMQMRQKEMEQSRLTELQRLDGELKQHENHRNEFVKRSSPDFKEAAKYLKISDKEALDALKRDKVNPAQIHAKFSKYREDLKKKEDAQKNKKKELKIATDKLVAARETLDEHREQFNRLLIEEQALEPEFKEWTVLRDLIEKQKNSKKKYALIVMLGEHLKSIKTTASSLSKRAETKLRHINSQMEVCEENEANVNTKSTEHKSADTEVEAFKKNYRAEILDKL